MKNTFIIDPDTFTVFYGKKSCFLGNTLAFRLLERLAQSPGIYISLHTLGEELWNDDLTLKNTIYKQASILRTKLRKARIEGIVIDATRDHYRLVLR